MKFLETTFVITAIFFIFFLSLKILITNASDFVWIGICVFFLWFMSQLK